MQLIKRSVVASAVATLMFVGTLSTSAQEKITIKENSYEFTPVIELEATPIKSQGRSGTCWSFSGISFFESEMIKKGVDPKDLDLSEMFIVRHCYEAKAKNYVRMHGNTNFGPGGAFHDVSFVMKNFGIVPNSVYKGLEYGETVHTHGELDGALGSLVKSTIKNSNKKISPVWFEAYSSILDSYFGEVPESFKYEGKKYTPKSFLEEYTKLDMEDYVEITSFTHHPFYTKFVIEIPDNWLWESCYNVPLNELSEIVDYALENGYTIGWASDVSEKGFATSKQGVAVIPDVDIEDMSNSEQARWEKMSKSDKEKELYNNLGKPSAEKVITQEMRQEAFDNYQTTDDHGMHIIGTAKDQNGKIFYKVKNSWGEYNGYKGYFYVSKAFINYKTTDIMVNKGAIPAHIKAKLNLK